MKNMLVGFALGTLALVASTATAKVDYSVTPKALYDVKEDVLDVAGLSANIQKGNDSIEVEYLRNVDTKENVYSANVKQYFGKPYVVLGVGYKESKTQKDQGLLNYGVGYKHINKSKVSPVVELRGTYLFDDKKSDVGLLGGLEFKF